MKKLALLTAALTMVAVGGAPGCRRRARWVLLVDETVSSAPTPPSPRSRRRWTPRSPATWTRCVPAPTQRKVVVEGLPKPLRRYWITT
jgi:hypothetical protein